MIHRSPDFRFRLLGFLPVCFFLSHLHYHFLQATPHHLLWMCNFSNLTLALGLLASQPLMIRIAALWLIPGLPLWIIDMTHTGDTPYSTFLSHVGGLAVAMVAMYQIRAKRNVWPFALAYGLSIQLLSRCTTPSELNVNVAFEMYYGWDQIFDSYWMFWLLIAGQAAAGLFLLEQIVLKIFPPNKTLSTDAFVPARTDA